jgi:hypothetical protein
MSHGVRISAGALIRNGRVLLVQRPAGDTFSLRWECPKGSTLTTADEWLSALYCWLEDNLGLQFVTFIGQCIWADSPSVDVDYRLYRMVCRGEAVSRNGYVFGWFTADDLDDLSCTPEMAAALPALQVVIMAAQ